MPDYSQFPCGISYCTQAVTINNRTDIENISIGYILRSPDTSNPHGFNLTDARADIERKSISVKIEAEKPGELILKLPRDSIDSIENGVDSEFIGFLDDKRISLLQESGSSEPNQPRYLDFYLPQGSHTIEVVGTVIAGRYGLDITQSITPEFTAPINLSNHADRSLSGINDMEVSDDNHVYATWMEDSENGWKIQFVSSLNTEDSGGGLRFDHIKTLSVMGNISQSFHFPQIASSGNNVYVTWLGTTLNAEGTSIGFVASHDEGATFDKAVSLTEVERPRGNLTRYYPGEIGPPQISAYNSSVYIVWQDVFSIYSIASHDYGKSFGPIRMLDTTMTENGQNNNGQVGQVRINAVEDNVYVIWQKYATKDDNNVFIRVSHDGGSSFEPTINLSKYDSNSSAEYPQLFAIEEKVYVSWETISNREYDSNHAAIVSSFDSGDSFREPTNLGHISASSAAVPILSGAANNVYVVWHDNLRGLVFRASYDGGATFSKDQILAQTSSDVYPQLVAGHDNVFVTWSGIDSQGSQALILRQSMDNGQNFGVKFLTPIHEVYNHNLAISSDHIYVSGVSDDMLLSYSPILPDPSKELVITEVELSSKNGTQWIKLYNPHDHGVSLDSVYLNGSAPNERIVLADNKITSIKPLSFYAVCLNCNYMNGNASDSSSPVWGNVDNTISIYRHDATLNKEVLWDLTPRLTDKDMDSLTWQRNNMTESKWLFDEHSESSSIQIPEFSASVFPCMAVAGIAGTIFLSRQRSWFIR